MKEEYRACYRSKYEAKFGQINVFYAKNIIQGKRIGFLPEMFFDLT